MEGESRVRRDTPTPDTRVHACLYFIAPTGSTPSTSDTRVHACLYIIAPTGRIYPPPLTSGSMPVSTVLYSTTIPLRQDARVHACHFSASNRYIV